jgi:hypothetical protein
MTPTIGRIVLFSPTDAPNFEFPAIVNRVFSSTEVALTVFQGEEWAGPSGSQAVAHAELSTDGTAQPGCWRWPPQST